MMLKRLLLLSMSIILVLVMTMGVFAGEIEADNQLSELEQAIIESAYSKIKEQIISDYEDLYKVDNFDYRYSLNEIDGKRHTFIDVYTDMTLTRNSYDSSFVAGMESALNETDSKEEQNYLQKVTDEYVNEIESLYYNIPNHSIFTYAIDLTDSVQMKVARNGYYYELFYRTDVDDEILLVRVADFSESENQREGYKTVYQSIKMKIAKQSYSINFLMIQLQLVIG